jgi:hypothetical protein
MLEYVELRQVDFSCTTNAETNLGSLNFAGIYA